jgi:hypothetical protein
MSLMIRRLVILAAGLVAGLLAWPLSELLLGVQGAFPSYLLFIVASGAVYGACFGLAFGSVDGITGGVRARKWLGLLLGFGIGLVGGALGAFVGQAIYLAIGQYLLQAQVENQAIGLPLARGLGWSVVGLIVGLGEGLRLRSGKRAAIGALGGFVGGLAGGLLVEYGSLALAAAWWTRLVGGAVLGLLLGLGLALTERSFLLGTLVLVTGPLRGREYPLPPGRTTIGSSVADTISLAPYRGVEERHAVLTGERGGMCLERGRDEVEIRVNEDPVERASLKYDDVIDVGSARFFLKTP